MELMSSQTVGARLIVVVGVVMAFACSMASVAMGATVTDTYGYNQQQFGPGGSFVVGGEIFGGVAVDATTGNILGSLNFNGVVLVSAPDLFVGGTSLVSVDTLNDPAVQGFPANIAVDPGNGSMYVSDGFGGPVHRYVTDGQPTPAYTADSTFALAGLGSVSSMAVDPVTHDLLVVDRGVNRVLRFSATGSLLDSFDGSGIAGGPGSPAGPFTGAAGISVGSSGTVYVSD